MTSLYDYVFSENGLVAYKNGELIARQVSLSLLSLVFSLNVSRSLLLLHLQSNLSTIATLMTEKSESKVVGRSKGCLERFFF